MTQPRAEAPLAFQQARGDRCRHQLALLCVWKGLSIAGQGARGPWLSIADHPSSRNVLVPSISFSRSPSQAGLGVSSSFSRTDEAGQVSKPARHARHEGGTGKRQGPTSLILSFTHYSTLLQKPPKREAKPVCNPQTHRALNLIIIELVGGGQAHAGAGGVPWVQ